MTDILNRSISFAEYVPVEMIVSPIGTCIRFEDR